MAFGFFLALNSARPSCLLALDGGENFLLVKYFIQVMVVPNLPSVSFAFYLARIFLLNGGHALLPKYIKGIKVGSLCEP